MQAEAARQAMEGNVADARQRAAALESERIAWRPR